MVYIVKNNKIVLSENKNKNGLYMISLENTDEEQPELPYQHKINMNTTLANNSQQDNTKRGILDYYHRCALCLRLSTWTEEIDKVFFNTRPGLTSATVKKYLPHG